MKALLKDGLGFAVRGDGVMTLIIGAGIYLAGSLAQWAPVIGPIAGLLISAYLCATFYAVVESSATGSDQMPMFPDVSNIFEDVIYPWLKMVVVQVLSFAPSIAYYLMVPDDQQQNWISLLLFAVGALYAVMASLAVIVIGRLSAMSPHIVLPAIKRAGITYWQVVLMLALLLAGMAGMNDMMSGVPILSAIVSSVISMYLLLTIGRLMGRMYLAREDQLNWL